MIGDKDKIALALELLKLDTVRSRVQSALATIPPEHNYEGTPRRSPRIRGAGKRYVVINAENRAIAATNDIEQAEFQAFDSYSGRKLLDLKDIRRYWRAQIANALRANPGSTRAQMPPVPPPPAEPNQRPYNPDAKQEQLLHDIRERCYELRQYLSPDAMDKLIGAASQIGSHAGYEAAADFIFEVNTLLYRDVVDQLNQEETITFDTADEAYEYAHMRNQMPDGMIVVKGKPTGRYRFKVARREA